VNALRSVSMDVYADSIVCLVGHNAAGKTTLVSCLTGLVQPDAGDVVVCGRSFRSSSDAVWAKLGVCPQVGRVVVAVSFRGVVRGLVMLLSFLWLRRRL
jgi:ABC-type multidrug transport system ATPase subunit